MIQLDTRCNVSSQHGIPLSVIQENVLIAISIKTWNWMLDSETNSNNKTI